MEHAPYSPTNNTGSKPAVYPAWAGDRPGRRLTCQRAALPWVFHSIPAVLLLLLVGARLAGAGRARCDEREARQQRRA